MKVGEVMKKVVVVSSDISSSDAVMLLSKRGIGSLVVMDGDKVIGIITEGDFIDNIGKIKSTNVGDIMTSPVITIGEFSEINEVIDLMNNNNVRRVPVVDKKGVLKGIVTVTDILAHSDNSHEKFFFD